MPAAEREPRLRTVTCASPRGLHRIAYTEWLPPGVPAAATRTVICVHGLTRNSRDFDVLAARLSGETGLRVICPDMLGRGRSDRATDPVSQYTIPQYIADCVTLIARTDAERIDWVGTSMGGLIGLALASLPGTPIARLVLNDIGPVVGETGRARIGTAVMEESPRFDDFESGEKVLRGRMGEFGQHTDEQFRYLSRHYVIERDGQWTFHYDPQVAATYRAALGTPMPPLWAMYDAIKAPTLVVRGADSDILTHADALAMTQRGPRAELVEIPGVGHAPTLIADEQVEPILAFLARS